MKPPHIRSLVRDRNPRKFELSSWQKLVRARTMKSHLMRAMKSPHTRSLIRDRRPRKFDLNDSNSIAIRTYQPIEAILDKLLRWWYEQ